MASDDKLELFFIPFYATGHLIPMLDLAFLFSVHPNTSATFVTTPSNASILHPTLDLYPTVNLLLFPFPAAESGLLPGQENISSIPFSAIPNLCNATDLSEPAIKHLLHLHRPDAIIADVAFSWMPSAARELGIPNLVFHAIGMFPQLALDSFHQERSYELPNQDFMNSSRLIKHLPGAEIHVPWSELPMFLRTRTYMTERWGRMKAAQAESYGVVVNTLYEMESEYCEEYRKRACKKAWFVGPTKVAAADAKSSTSAVSTTSSTPRHPVMKWLDGKPEESVVFVCLGSWCNFSDEQLREFAAGIEQSHQRFVWVVKGAVDWMAEGWEERVAGRGIVVKGWAPQAEILKHSAVGVFVTHCGWNSLLEAVAAGVPVMTWPLVFEQFMNERLVVDVLGGGVRVWEGFRSAVEEEKVVVTGEAIGRTIKRFVMGESGEKARMRMREMSMKARVAVEEGGASKTHLVCLIDELFEEKRKRGLINSSLCE